MQATEKKNEGLSRSYEVKIPSKDLEQKVDTKLQGYAGQIRMPGFRPGKVPLKLLKQKHGRAVLGEVIEEAVQESSQKLLKDKNLRPAMQPKIEIDQNFDEGKDLIYNMDVEILPEFEVMNFKGLKLEKPVAKVSDEQIDEALGKIAANRKDSTPIEGKRASKTGDIVVIDFHGRTADDNKEHPGMHAHGHSLELGSNSFIPGFEEQLTGKKAGEKVEVKVSFPEDYGAAELAGRDAIFDVDISEIREPKETDINDEFAQSLGLEDVKALRNAVSEQLVQEYETHSKLKLKKQLLDIIDEKHDFDVPAGMIDIENDQIIRQIKMEQQQTGDDSELSDSEKEELREIARRRVKLGLVLSEVGHTQKITVSDPELQQAVIREAQKYPGQEKQVFDFYAKNKNALESLRAPMFEEKTVDYILELADVSEKETSIEDLTAEEELFEDAKPKKKTTSKAKSAKKEEGEKKPATKVKTTTASKKEAVKKDEESKPKKKPAAKKKAS